MFEGAQRSAEARATVIGPTGKSPNAPQPLTPVRPHALADFGLHAISAAVVVPVAILTASSWWSAVGLAIGLAIGLSILSTDRHAGRAFDDVAPAEPGANVETARRAVRRGLRGGYSVAGQSLVYTLLSIGHVSAFAAFFAGAVAPAAVGSGLNLLAVIRGERRLGASVVHHVRRGQPLSVKGQLYFDVGRPVA